jgi:hypothetical protein
MEAKTCEDCTRFLLCKKVKDITNPPPICTKFEDNFPEIKDEEDEQEDLTVEKPTTLYKCIGASVKCTGCPHATPHNPFDEDEYLDGSCVTGGLCEDARATVKCVAL